MSKYYVDNKKINISWYHKPFAQGSEGSLYLIDNKLYKIYNSSSLNDGFGEKETYHQFLSEVRDQFKRIILPESLIYDRKKTILWLCNSFSW